MITGKTPEHEIYARYSIEQFREQTYTSKKLIIINDGEFSLQDICDDNVIEVRVDNSDKKLTLGDLRNIGLDQIEEGDIWVQWDDDDYRDPMLLENQYRVFSAGIEYFAKSRTKNNNRDLHIPNRKITPKACFLHSQYRYIQATNHLFKFSSSKTFRGFTKGIMGTGMFVKVNDIKYPSLSRSEDEEFRDLYDQKYGIVTFINDPLLYVKVAHNESTWEWEYYYEDKCKRSGSDMKTARNQWQCSKSDRYKIMSILSRFNKSVYHPLLSRHRSVLDKVQDIKQGISDIAPQSGEYKIISRALIDDNSCLYREETLKDHPEGRQRWFDSTVKITYNRRDVNIRYKDIIYQTVQRSECSDTKPCIENMKIIHTSDSKRLLFTCSMCTKYTLAGNVEYQTGVCEFDIEKLTISILHMGMDFTVDGIFFKNDKIYKLASITPLRFTEVADVKDNIEFNPGNAASIVTHPISISGDLYGFCYQTRNRRKVKKYKLAMFYTTDIGISPLYYNPSKLEHMNLPVYLANGMDLLDFQLKTEKIFSSGNQHYSKYWRLDVNI